MAGRNPFATPQGIGFFDAEADETFRLDLSNAMPLADNHGALRDLGPIHAAVPKHPDAETNAGSQTWAVTPAIKEGDAVAAVDILDLGEIPYRQADWLVLTGGVAEVPLPPAARALAKDHPLALVQPLPGAAGGWTVLIRETIGGLLVRADEFVHRVDAQKGHAVARRANLMVRRYGGPAAAVPITLAQRGREDGEGIGNPAPNPFKASIPPIGVPTTALTEPAAMVSDALGTAPVDLQVSDPANARSYLDGQIYKLDYQLAIAGVSPMPMLDQIVLHVRDGFEPPRAPDWDRDVKPILVQYGNLYPIMSRGLFSFADQTVVAAHAHLLKFAFERPDDDSNHMPVTRDLSAGKRKMIVSWLDQQFHLESSDPVVATASVRVDVAALKWTPSVGRPEPVR